MKFRAHQPGWTKEGEAAIERAMVAAVESGGGTTEREFQSALRSNSNEKVVAAMIAKGTDVNAPINGNSPLYTAAESGAGKNIDLLLDAGANVNATNDAGETALLVAARKGRVAVVKRLVEAGADINARTDKGITPVKAALWSEQSAGWNDATKALLDLGADVNGAPGQPSLLEQAIAEGKNNAVRILVEAKPSLALNDTALVEAVGRNNGEAIKILANAGANVNVLVDKKGNTLLHLAARKDAPEVAAALIAAGAEVNTINNRGITPLKANVMAHSLGSHTELVLRDGGGLMDAPETPAPTRPANVGAEIPTGNMASEPMGNARVAGAVRGASGAAGLVIGGMGLVNSLENGDYSGAGIAAANVAISGAQTVAHVTDALAPAAVEKIGIATTGKALGELVPVVGALVTVADGLYQVSKEDTTAYKEQRATATAATVVAGAATGAVLGGGGMAGVEALSAVIATGSVAAAAEVAAPLAVAYGANIAIETTRVSEANETHARTTNNPDVAHHSNLTMAERMLAAPLERAIVNEELLGRLEPSQVRKNKDGSYDLTNPQVAEIFHKAVEAERTRLLAVMKQTTHDTPAALLATTSLQEDTATFQVARANYKLLDSADKELRGEQAKRDLSGLTAGIVDIPADHLKATKEAVALFDNALTKAPTSDATYLPIPPRRDTATLKR